MFREVEQPVREVLGNTVVGEGKQQRYIRKLPEHLCWAIAVREVVHNWSCESLRIVNNDTDIGIDFIYY